MATAAFLTLILTPLTGYIAYQAKRFMHYWEAAARADRRNRNDIDTTIPLDLANNHHTHHQTHQNAA